MAALSKNGHEIARLTKQVETPGDELTVWERTEYSVRSNRWILRKRTVRFRADKYSAARTHSYGWKRYGRLKPDGNLDRWLQAHADRGFTVERFRTLAESAGLPLFGKVGAA